MTPKTIPTPNMNKPKNQEKCIACRKAFEATKDLIKHQVACHHRVEDCDCHCHCTGDLFRVGCKCYRGERTITCFHCTKPKPTESMEQGWEKKFEELDYLFHGIEDGNQCWGDKSPIYSEDGTAPKQLIGYKTGQCFCGGEDKKNNVKSFIHKVRQQALEEHDTELVKRLKKLDKYSWEKNRDFMSGRFFVDFDEVIKLIQENGKK